MISSKEDIISEISRINHELHSPVDNNKNETLRFAILDLIKDTILFLNKENPLSLWEKSHIVGAIDAISWNWLFLAISKLKLSIADKSQISPNNNYKKEITDLTSENIIRYIDQLKSSLQKNIL